ncbi:MAG: PASTA domain-containing protein, partial [Jatrophihabitantaceae bacterium]
TAPTPGQEFSNTVPAGEFLRSDPPAGTKVERGYSTVTLYISKGPDYVAVPTITTGTPVSQAQSALKNAGFKVIETDAFSDSVTKGEVISVNPADRQVRGQAVTLAVSKGPEFVTIPKIKSGTSSGDASAQLTALGLQVKLDTSYDGGIFDRIVGMDPKAGTQVRVGSVVTLLVV